MKLPIIPFVAMTILGAIFAIGHTLAAHHKRTNGGNGIVAPQQPRESHALSPNYTIIKHIHNATGNFNVWANETTTAESQIFKDFYASPKGQNPLVAEICKNQ